ncbi:hypothetical protein CALVIDRAFT_597874 [Calocera viscosa TUFC12733]|uniref:Telomere-associated protein Rif1 N-terminal domain-containing protein n=1 Tax=Calocera viscosa (strain TUFC12733) TaxID=1330018 RepID=A0A167MY38_CALVF|nr:hypothetical protein CALVIDRAFT_597874 [Calocera viscosa TUFC12733]
MSPPPPLPAHHTFAPNLPHSTPLHPNPHKENIPPPLTPSTQGQRVEFAPTPYYAPSPSLSHSHRFPLKGILKPPRMCNAMDTDALDPPSSSPPEEAPSAPIADPHYLQAPLNTLLRSLASTGAGADADQPTTHDLTEAHAVLLARLKHARHLLPPALEPLHSSRAPFLAALSRDVARALSSPYVPCSSSDDLPSPSPAPGGKRGVSEEEIVRARDEIALCHGAIKLCAVVLLQPGVHGLFSEKDLETLFAGLLALPAATQLPTPNPKRTNHYALWALGNARVPYAVLLPHRTKLARVLERGIRGELGARGGAIGGSGEVVRGQAFDTLTSFLTHYPELLPPLTPLLPIVLNALLPTSSLRPKATNTLLAYSLALKKHRALLSSQGKNDLKEREAVEKLVLAWLKTRRAPSGPGGSGSSGEEKPIDSLERSLRTSLLSPTEQHLVLPLIASLLHLAGPQVLAWSGLKAVMGVLQAGLKQPALLGEWARGWGVLVWGVREGEGRGLWPAPENNTNTTSATPAAAAAAGTQPSRERIEKMVRQAISALVKAGGAAQAGEVWRALVWAGVERGGRRWSTVEGVVRAEGVGGLLDVLRGAGGLLLEEEDDDDDEDDEAASPSKKEEEQNRSLECLLDESLFTPSLSSKSQAQGIKPAPLAALVPKWWKGLTPEDWRKSAGALEGLWFAGLAATSTTASAVNATSASATAATGDTASDPAELTPLDAADELLRLLCRVPETRRRLFDRLLASTPQDLGTRGEQEWAQRARRFLTIVVGSTKAPALRAIFGPGGSSKPGQELARTLVQALMGPKVDSWKAPVIADVLGMDGFLWNQGGLEDLASWVRHSLIAPDGEEWKPLARPVLALWLPRLERGLGLDSGGVMDVLSISRAFPEQWRAALTAVGDKALEYVALGLADLPALLACEREDTLRGAALDVLGACIRGAYDDPEKRDGAEEVLAALLGSVQRLAASRDKEGALEIVRQIESSVGEWLRDEKEVLSEESYTTNSTGIYIACLSLLTPLETVDQETLDALAPFLSCAFYRMPVPGLGPQAFRRFWTSTFHGHEFEWPQELKPALRWFAKQDRTFAPGLGLEPTQTQTSAGASVPVSVLSDSEPERAMHRLVLTMELSASEANSMLLASRGTVRHVSFEHTQESYDAGESVSSIHPDMTRMGTAAEGTSLQMANSTILLDDLSDPTPSNIPSGPLRETQEASQSDDEDVPQVSDEIVSTAVIMQAFNAPRTKFEELETSDESITTPTQSVISPTTSILNSTPSILLEPANADATTAADDTSAGDISVVPETQFPRTTSRTGREGNSPSAGLLSTTSDEKNPIPSSPTFLEEDDEADAAVIEFSLSQELGELDDDDVFVPPPASALGKRKRTRSGSISSTRKKRKTPSTPSRDGDEEEEVQNRLAMTSSAVSTPSKISSAETSIQEVEDTFTRDEASKTSVSQPTPSSSRETPTSPSLSQPSTSGVEQPKKRKRLFVESVEILTPPKRRRITTSDGKSKSVEVQKRVRYAGDDELTTGVSLYTSTPAALSKNQSQSSIEGESQTSPGTIAAAGSQFWRGVRYAFSRVAGQKGPEESQESASMSQIVDETSEAAAALSSSVSEQRVKTLRQLLKEFKEDVKNVDIGVVGDVQSGLIDALSDASKRMKAEGRKRRSDKH